MGFDNQKRLDTSWKRSPDAKVENDDDFDDNGECRQVPSLVTGEDELKQENTVESSVGGGREDRQQMKEVYIHEVKPKVKEKVDKPVEEGHNFCQYEGPVTPASPNMSPEQAKIIDHQKLFTDKEHIESSVGLIELHIRPKQTAQPHQDQAPLLNASAARALSREHSPNSRKTEASRKYKAPVYNNRMRNSFFSGTFKT